MEDAMRKTALEMMYYLWPTMPTLKNKKICEDVPPQLDLGPRPSFDSAHLDVPSDEFPVCISCRMASR